MCTVAICFLIENLLRTKLDSEGFLKWNFFKKNIQFIEFLTTKNATEIY
jgi:hypothetical protein